MAEDDQIFARMHDQIDAVQGVDRVIALRFVGVMNVLKADDRLHAPVLTAMLLRLLSDWRGVAEYLSRKVGLNANRFIASDRVCRDHAHGAGKLCQNA